MGGGLTLPPLTPVPPMPPGTSGLEQLPNSGLRLGEAPLPLDSALREKHPILLVLALAQRSDDSERRWLPLF